MQNVGGGKDLLLIAADSQKQTVTQSFIHACHDKSKGVGGSCFRNHQDSS